MILKPFKARVLTELIKEGEDREESQGGPSRGDRMMENEIGGMAEEYNILEVNWREYFNKEGNPSAAPDAARRPQGMRSEN